MTRAWSAARSPSCSTSTEWPSSASPRSTNPATFWSSSMTRTRMAASWGCCFLHDSHFGDRGVRPGSSGPTWAAPGLGPAEDDPRRELPLGIERQFDRAHLVDRAIAVELPQQRLLERAPADAVLGERAAAEPRGLAAEFENGLAAGHDVIPGPGNGGRGGVCGSGVG